MAEGATAPSEPMAAVPGAGERVALVLGGGGMVGGVYEIGALRALDLLLADRSVTGLDVYVGTSAGAMIAALCASGVTPEEMMRTTMRDSEAPFRDIGARDLLSPNLGELLRRAACAPARLASLAFSIARRRHDVSVLDVALALADALPSAWYTSAGIERYMRGALAAHGSADDFAGLRGELLIAATDLDSCERVVLGGEGMRDVPISVAVRASTALPMLYPPVRVKGRELIDGGIVSTTNLDLAVQAGATLVFVVNPIVPFVSPDGAPPDDRWCSANRGLTRIGFQAFRLVAHQRLHEMARSWEERFPGVDIILIEPRTDDELMSQISLMSFSSRIEIARHGFESVTRQLAGDFERMSAICARHGLSISAAELDAVLATARMAEEQATEADERAGGRQTRAWRWILEQTAGRHARR